MKRFSIVTLGCKVNQFDSEMIIDNLIKNGYELAKPGEKSDIFIINTCTVTHRADFQSRQMIRRAHRLNPSSLIIVTGCYSQVQPESLEKMKEINYILGNKEKEYIAEIISSMEKRKSPRIQVSEIKKDQSIIEITVPSFFQHTRAYLKIQDGCNSQCSYCIVPYARGTSRSLPSDKILENMKLLKERGYKEVILTGINIGSYGIDLDQNLNLEKLLKLLEEAETPDRIRLSSIEPFNLSKDLIRIISESTKICPHLHIPIQSGDNDILRYMNRNYDRAFISELIYEIYQKIPYISIGVDIIIGFPGETEDRFRNTYELIERLPISYLHVFPFSLRKGTQAENFDRHVHPMEIKKRTEIIRNLGKKKRLEFYQKFLGKELKVLGLDTKGKEREKLKGISRNYIHLILNDGKIKEKSYWINKEWDIKTTAFTDQMMFGELIS